MPTAQPAVERSPVTREAIVGAALDLLTDGGLDAVSFRRIAGRLGVAAPTLYWHVDNKRHLMDLMAEELLDRTGASSSPPRPGQPWWDWLRAHATGMFEALVATRDAPRVLAGNRPTRPALGRIEESLRVLVAAGLTPGQAQQTLFALGSYVIGSATEWQAEAERRSAAPRPDPADDVLSAGRAVVLAGHPTLLAAVDDMLRQPPHATFEFGLDLLVDGLRTRYAPPG
jgi:TetR/AcrR family tetracycline transcriptional repressor